VACAIGAQFCINLASGLVVRGFSVTSASALVLMRNAFGAVVLLAVSRPRLRGHSRLAWLGVVAYGAAVAALNSFFYESLRYLDVGPAVTIEMLGPLGLSVVLARRGRAWLWAGLALVGIVLLSGFDPAVLVSRGTGLALCAAFAWAGYILAARLVGREFAGVEGMALGMALAAVLCLPRGLIGLGEGPFTSQVVGLGLVIALVATVAPYILELTALRGMAASTFGVLTALAPASAALFGWLVAGQTLGPAALAGMVLVIVASVGAARGDPARTAAAG
jgi:inner membrane transporter RhtA